ncbi:DUF4937 domain-containing protein [Shewanella sp. 202IG2-18]|uniref:DUF4937 domain-containing protein n=1 Tax=Parashewanella hymeniacidonis TaxID=2807618 RepID=UPI00196221F7|nr:DUF4937 domain-containing protein [Parashewanella hymeniacidonis]MBM7074554.1 DUF4937 domain-containing protein [Parashewanella hymeniacidonis]
MAKLIKCQVPPRNRTEFSVGQQYWKQTNAADGFIFQLGDWTKDTAVILALWKDEASIESFMKTLYDPIADKAQQANCYSSKSVNYLKRIMDIPAYLNSSTTHAKLAHRRYLNNEFPLLKQKAHLDRHMQDVDGFTVITEPTWDVF